MTACLNGQRQGYFFRHIAVFYHGMMDKNPPSIDANRVRSVERAADLLEALMATRQPISLAHLSELVDLHPSTAHRLLATLEKRQFVYQDRNSRHYSIGPKLMNPAHSLRSIQQLRNLAMPVLQSITEELGENASLAVRSGNQAMLVAQVSGSRKVNVRIQPDTLAPLHATAVGKVILAYLDPEELEQVLQETNLPAITPHTITDIQSLTQALQAVCEAGYATDDEEWELGIRCVAVPLFLGEGNLMGAVSVSAPAGRVDKTRQKRFVEIIQKQIAALGKNLGGGIQVHSQQEALQSH